MGRARKMELIGNEKSRIRTLMKRGKGLTKQLEQLTILCDVPACIIIRDPTTNSSSNWPQDSDRVRRLIDGCKDPSGVRTYGVSDFFKERQKQVEGELFRLRKKNNNLDDCLSSMDEGRLRELAAALRAKAEAVRSRIEFLKREKEESLMMMMKKNSDSAHIDDQDMIFMDAMNKNNLFAYCDSAHIDQDMIFMESVMKKNNLFAYSDSTHIDQDMIFMDAMKKKKKNNLFAYSDSAQFYDIDQDMINSGGFMDVMKKINLFDYSDSAQFGDMNNSGGFVEMKNDDMMLFDYPGLAQFGDMIKTGGFVEMKEDDEMLFDYPELYY